MSLKDIPVKKLTKHVSLVLKRNFLEWKCLKKEVFSKSKLKDPSRDDDKKIERIISSEPIAAFYAHWLKSSRSRENNSLLQEKTHNYIKGLFLREFADQRKFEIFLLKYGLLNFINHATATKMVESALAIQKLRSSKKVSLKEVFKNERDFKLILRSSMSGKEWSTPILMLFRWITMHEIGQKNWIKLNQAIHTVVSKREKEIFS